MRRYLPGWAILAGLLFLLTTAPAGAQSTNAVQAESLFRDGIELMEAGDFDRACEAFQASQQLDPAVGTQLNLGRCYEKAGRIASAWSVFSDAVAAAKMAEQKERADLARSEAARLRHLVPKVVVLVEGLDETTVVTLDGNPLQHAVLKFGIPVDPGAHEVRVIRGENEPEVRTFEAISEENVQPIELSFGATTEPDAADGSQDPASETIPESSDSAASLSTKQTGGWSTLRWAGAGIGIAGVAGVIVGAVLGQKALSDADKADCDDTGCSEQGLSDKSDAQSLLTTGYVVGIAGGVVAAGGITLFVLAPPNSSGEVALRAHLPGSGVTGLSLSGRF